MTGDESGAFVGLARAVSALHRAFAAAGESIAGSAGLTHAGSTCLQQIADEPATVAQVAGELNLARQGVQRVADQLVAAGFAEYADNPRHRRAKLLVITVAGQWALREIATAHAKWVSDHAAGIPRGELAELTQRLHDIRSAIGPPRR